jgi:hypothetical protein
VPGRALRGIRMNGERSSGESRDFRAAEARLQTYRKNRAIAQASIVSSAGVLSNWRCAPWKTPMSMLSCG